MARPRSLVKYVLPQQLGGTTTKAVGEEGGVTTLAVGEESAKPPPVAEVSTLRTRVHSSERGSVTRMRQGVLRVERGNDTL